MSAINATKLANMRATITDHLLPDTCVINAKSTVSDGAGGWTPGYSPVAGGTVVCRLDPIMSRAQVMELLGRETLTTIYRLTTPHDAPLAQDRQVVTGGKTYEIVQLDDLHSWNVSRRAIVSEVR